MNFIEYQDSVTILKAASSGYRGSKDVSEYKVVPAIFIQSTGFIQAGFQENIDADAICFPDPESQFVLDNFNRLEGMYLIAEIFGVDEDDAWYKIIDVTVNRDHLLENEIDNVQLNLKKTEPIPGIS